MSEIFEREKDVIYQTYGRLPICVEEAKGSFVYDDKGNKYLDFISGIAVNALGHGNPEIISAVTEQIKHFMHLSNYFYQKPQVELAEKLIEHTKLDKVFFANSGTEAVEGVIKLMRKWGNENNRHGIYAFPDAFHGRTMGALSLMRQEKYRENMAPFLSDMMVVDDGIEQLYSDVMENCVGFIFEPIQGEGGIAEMSKDIIDRLKQLQKENGCLLVVDEIQAGIGRTGKMFSYQHYGIEPDVILTAKALGGGLPLGAMIVNKKLSSVFKPGNHGTTFGGNAVACSAGIAVLKQLENGVLDNVNEIGNYFIAELEKVKQKHLNKVIQVRGKGLMLGLQFKSDPADVKNRLLEKKVLCCTASNNVLRILPPLNVEKETIDYFIIKLNEVLNEI